MIELSRSDQNCKILERKFLELMANGYMFYPIVKLFGTWILRKRLAEWTFSFITIIWKLVHILTARGLMSPRKNAFLSLLTKRTFIFEDIFEGTVTHRIGGNRERRFLNNFSFSIAKINVFDCQNRYNDNQKRLI